MHSDGHHLAIFPQNAEHNLTRWIVLPEKPIKIGDSWTQELSHQMLITPDPELDFMLTSTLIGFERVEKYNSAKLELNTPKQAIDVPEKNESKLTVFFALNEGFPVKVEGIIKSKSDEEVDLFEQSDEETKAALEKFVSDYPKSRWRQGVEGLIARFSSQGEDATMIDEQPEEISGNFPHTHQVKEIA